MSDTSAENRTSATSRPDYTCPAYNEMAKRWQLVEDCNESTPAIRAKKEIYLPKFEAESNRDWHSRVSMTFMNDHYSTTLAEHVGLILSDSPKLGDDVPQPIRDLTEDIDGEGNHLDVFAQDALTTALHYGHCVLFTDYPVTDAIRTLRDERMARARPYVTIYRAKDILSWRTATVGGLKVLVRVVFRETTSEAEGEFGTVESTRYREIKQEVKYDQISGMPVGLGGITWKLWAKGDPAIKGGEDFFRIVAEGTINGPNRICARVVYGGEKLGVLHTKPHLIGLAYSNIEETLVASDYANVMHKTNVPTPIFIGRNINGDMTKSEIKMGQGIDIPQGGDAKFLEPSGAALSATRQRLEDIRVQMRRQGATVDDATGKVMTAAEARLYAKQRNSKLKRAARSLQDALEGVLEDIASFMRLSDGGSIAIKQEFGDDGVDPAYLNVLVLAYEKGALPLEALMYALEKGRLPDDFTAEEAALRLISEHAATIESEGLNEQAA